MQSIITHRQNKKQVVQGCRMINNGCSKIQFGFDVQIEHVVLDLFECRLDVMSMVRIWQHTQYFISLSIQKEASKHQREFVLLLLKLARGIANFAFTTLNKATLHIFLGLIRLMICVDDCNVQRKPSLA